MNKIKIITKNLIGDLNHKSLLKLQTSYGISQRGGSVITNFSKNHINRISSDVNLLTKAEVRTLIFNETTYSN